MSRIALSVVVAAVVGVSLTGCSSALSSNSSSETLQTLKFESDPLGAEVRTPQGQTRRRVVPPAHFDRRQCDCDYHDCQKTGLYEEMNFNHTADAHFLDAASAAVAVAAEAVGGCGTCSIWTPTWG